MNKLSNTEKLGLVKLSFDPILGSITGAWDLVFIKEASTGNSTVKSPVNSTLNSTGNSTGNSTVKSPVNSTLNSTGNSTLNAFKNPFDKLYGAVAVSKDFEDSKPAGQTTMRDLISPYYENIPGGLDGVIERADKYRQSLKGTPEENFPFLSTNKDDWDKKMDVRNFGGINSLFYGGYTIPPSMFSDNPFITANEKGFNPQTMFINEKLNPVGRRITKEHEGSHLLQFRDPNYSEDKMYLNRKPPLLQESYYEMPGEKAPRLAHIRRNYAQQTGNEVTDPEIARDAYDWYRKWIENKKERMRRSFAVIEGLDPSDINLNSMSEEDLEVLIKVFNSRVEQARKDLESSDIFNRGRRARKLDELIKKQRELINIRKQFPEPDFDFHGDEDAWIDLYDNPESMRVMPGLVWNNPLRRRSYFS